MTSAERTTKTLDDFDDFLGLNRISGLAVSRDGSRIVTTVAQRNGTGTEVVSSPLELDPAGPANHSRRQRRVAPRAFLDRHLLAEDVEVPDTLG